MWYKHNKIENCKMVNLWNNTRLNQVGGYSAWSEEWSCDLVMWYNYVKPVRILKRCANNFSCWDEILGRRPGSQVLWDHVNRKIFSKMGMTLWSLKTYGYIGSKTKNYQIQRRFLLLFIFLSSGPWPFGCMPFDPILQAVCLQNFCILGGTQSFHPSLLGS